MFKWFFQGSKFCSFIKSEEISEGFQSYKQEEMSTFRWERRKTRAYRKKRVAEKKQFSS